MHEFDRVLDRKDMAFELAIDCVDHGGQCRRLTRAGFAGHENQPASRRGELVQRSRHLQLFERQAFRWNASKHCTDAVQVSEHVDTETSDVGNEVRKVRRVVLVELLERLLRHDAEQLRAQLLGVETLIVERDEIAVDAHARRIARDHVQVRALAHVHAAQKVVDQCHRRFLFSPCRCRQSCRQRRPASWGCSCRSAARSYP
jgi:hypothetical protein